METIVFLVFILVCPIRIGKCTKVDGNLVMVNIENRRFIMSEPLIFLWRFCDGKKDNKGLGKKLCERLLKELAGAKAIDEIVEKGLKELKNKKLIKY